MSWSLQLRNGDLALDGARLGKTEGGNKIAQDLRCALLTKLGHDPLHPQYGSVLIGGQVNGREVSGVAGSDDWERAALLIDSEIRRVIRIYQAYQGERIRADMATYGRSTLTASEVVASVADIDFTVVQDTLLVKVTILSQADNEQSITLSVTAPAPLG